MAAEAVSSQLASVKAWVLDEHQVVSYAWLSQRLSVSANVAKRLLFAFAQEHADEVDVRHVMSGETKDGGMAIKIVPAASVAATKSGFAKLHSQHVYSVQARAADKEEASGSDRKDISGRMWSAAFAQTKELISARTEAGDAFRSNHASAVINSNIKVRGPRRALLGAARAQTAPPASSARPRRTPAFGAKTSKPQGAGSGAANGPAATSTVQSSVSVPMKKPVTKPTTAAAFFSGHAGVKRSASASSASSSRSTKASKSGGGFFAGHKTSAKKKKKQQQQQKQTPPAAAAPAPAVEAAKPKPARKPRKKLIVESDSEDDEIIDEAGMHAAFDRERELQESKTVPYQSKERASTPPYSGPKDDYADLEFSSDEEQDGGAGSDTRSPAKKRKQPTEEDATGAGDGDDDEEGCVTHERKSAKRQRKAPSTPSKQKKSKRKQKRQTEEEDDEEVGISVMEPSSPVRDPSSVYFDAFKATPSPQKQGIKKKQKRKLVTKTFMDEQGYMVTQEVWETSSEPDSQSPSPKNDTPSEVPSAEAPGAAAGVMSPNSRATSLTAKLLAEKRAKRAAATAKPSGKAKAKSKTTGKGKGKGKGKRASNKRKQSSLMSFFGGK